MDRILSRLYLSGLEDVLKLNKDDGFDIIVSILDNIAYEQLGEFRLDKEGGPCIMHYAYVLDDGASASRAGAVITEAVEIITSEMSNMSKVLVHCGAGWSRSAAVVVGYLIKIGMSRPEAVDFVKSRRVGVCIAPTFMDALKNVYGEENCIP